MGLYDVFYYRVRDGQIEQLDRTDRGVGESHLEAVKSALGRDEYALAPRRDLPGEVLIDPHKVAARDMKGGR